MAINQVSIALKPNVYNTFRNLVNTIPNTLGEYIDNAIQSYLDNKEQLRSYEPNYKLKIKITMNWEQKILSIEDNAAGINGKNYIRAFEPANIPSDNTGLNEYGMGLKTASIWLADNWTVTTKALDEDVERKISFDLEKVTREEKEELSVIETKKSREEHYTKIELTKLSENAPKTNTMETVKKHLTSIYRKFLRTDEIEIFVDDKKLSFTEYKILNTPFYDKPFHVAPGTEPKLWKEEINYRNMKYKAKGFIALLNEMKNCENGLVLMRRGRVIKGGGDERFFPPCIFGSTTGTYKYKRLFGELELEGFDVSFNKNSFKGGDEEELNSFLQELVNNIKDKNIFQQANNYRQRSQENIDKTANSIKKCYAKKRKKTTEELEEEVTSIKDKESIRTEEELLKESRAEVIYEEETTKNNDQIVPLSTTIVKDSESSYLYSVIELLDSGYECKINLSHPFFDKYPQLRKTNECDDPIIELLRAFAKAEIAAPPPKICRPESIRQIFNEFISRIDK